MDTVLASSVGTFVLVIFQGLLTTPSWPAFTLLSCGWALASGRHTITAYRWLTGAAAVKHFARCAGGLGGPFYEAHWPVGACIIRQAAQLAADDTPLVRKFDDSTTNKAGTSRAGVARQEYRTLRGLHFVRGVMRIPLRWWPGPCITLPRGLALYLKEVQAQQVGLPYHSRRALARAILEFGAGQLPGRRLQATADGGYTTRAFVRGLPASVAVVSRRLVAGKLSALPTPPAPRMEAPPDGGGSRGPRLGRPLAQRPAAAAGAGSGGPAHPCPAPKPPPPIEAFFTTALPHSVEEILPPDRDRWAVDIGSRDANAVSGRGHEGTMWSFALW